MSLWDVDNGTELPPHMMDNNDGGFCFCWDLSCFFTSRTRTRLKLWAPHGIIKNSKLGFIISQWFLFSRRGAKQLPLWSNSFLVSHSIRVRVMACVIFSRPKKKKATSLFHHQAFFVYPSAQRLLGEALIFFFFFFSQERFTSEIFEEGELEHRILQFSFTYAIRRLALWDHP